MTKLISHLEDGQVSDVAELPFGCTIVKLVERKTFEPISYEQARTGLYNEAFDRKAADQYREWIEELRDRTFIERRGYFADAVILHESSSSGKLGGTARP